MPRIRALFVLLASTVLTTASPAGSGSSEASENGASGLWRGRVDALVVDNFQTGASRTRFFLRTSGETLELQAPEGIQLRSGQWIEVDGRRTGRRLAASHVSIRASVADPSQGCSATGVQRALVILASFPSKALLSSITSDLLQASLFGPGRTLNGFLLEASYGQTSVTGDVLGPYVLDGDYFDQPLAVRDAALRAAAPHVDLTQYNRIFVVAPQGQSGMDSGGMALLGCGQIASPQGELNASSIWMGAESMAAQNQIMDIASHEMGHAFGLEHARFADYGGEPLGPVGQAPAPWDAVHEYGDSYSSMGRYSGQWAAPQKALMGWLQPGAGIQTVTQSGAFHLAPYESSGGGQVLRVSRGGGNAWLWVEYRQPQGTFDGTLPAAAFAGALVHYEDPALTATVSGADPSSYTNLVNFHPRAAGGDPELHPGESWTDPYGALTISINAASAAGLDLNVSYAAAPSCPSNVGGAQSFNAAGGAATVVISAPQSCSWTASASADWIAVAAPATGGGNGSVGLTVAANPAVSPRWAKISVGDAFVIVSQAGSSGALTISPQAAGIPAAGGTGQISVATSAPDVSWTMSANVPWITDLECSCYIPRGPATVRYIVAANPGAQRSGVIHIGGQSYSVTQDAGDSTLAVLAFTDVAPKDAPQSRLEQALAPFGHSGQALLYGGAWDGHFYAETWLWKDSNWTALHPANNPGPLAGHAMAYDEARGNIVLFGGIGGDGVGRNDTWVWDGQNWRKMQPSRSPAARNGHAMVYDPLIQKVVLFGGYGNSGELNDTWTWDGTNWTLLTTGQSPSPRTGHAMAYDAARGQIVLFGGMYNPTPAWLSDTWLFDGSSWRQALSTAPPPARFGHAMAWHPVLQGVVMVGGYGGKDVSNGSWIYDFRRETWVWDGAAWSQQFPAVQPGAAYTVGAVWDDANQALTVHVGDDLTCISRGPKTYRLTAPAAATQPAFTFTAAAPAVTITPGAAQQVRFSTALSNGFYSAVAMSINGLPSGVTASFAPAAIAAPGNGSATLTLQAAIGTAAGAFSALVQASGGGVSRAQPLSITITAPPAHGITYSGNGNTSGTAPADANKYVAGTRVTVLGNTAFLAKTGYSFGGWSTSAVSSGTTYAPGASFTMGNDNVTLYAVWTPVPHTVIYSGNGSTSGTPPVDATKYVLGAQVKVLANTGNVAKTGYSFGGWSTSAAGSGPAYAPGASFPMGNDNVTLYAVWRPVPHTVIYSGNGGTSGAPPVDATKYVLGAPVKVLANTGNLAKTGYSFGGWNTSAAGSGAAYSPGASFSMGNGNVTLYAVWTPVPHTVIYSGNGSTSGTPPVDATKYVPGAQVKVLPNTGNVAKTGYSFGGWSTSAAGSGPAYAPGASFPMGNENVTLYAWWRPVPHTVSYSGNGSTSGTPPVDVNKYLPGARVTVLGNTGKLAKTGYSFGGWSTSALSGTAIAPGASFSMGGENVTLYAQWIKQK
ncbi:MAG TPA: InlB B-repeat-containing protein [Bryobacteraceae bacterium]|nr:InlB B-repeat-containing protein [Bryobacteraceae bacterium]